MSTDHRSTLWGGEVAGRRGPVVASRGVASAGHPLVTNAATQVLAEGGNAADAAVSAAAVQCVVEFPWCGVGGDAFVLVHHPEVGAVALNGCGAAPGGIRAALAGHHLVPRFGPLSMTVPGEVDAWERLSARFGSRPLAELLEPATGYATEGFAVDHRLATALQRLGGAAGDFPTLGELLADNGRSVGETFVQPDLAGTLRAIRKEGAGALYSGKLARRIAEAVAGRGGVLAERDIAHHRADWKAPLATGYRDVEVVQSPPPSLGVALLQQLRFLDGFDFSDGRMGSVDVLDTMLQGKRAAFDDAYAVLADPDHVDVPVAWLLSDERVAWWWDQMEVRAPGTPAAASGLPSEGIDTSSLAVADRHGMTVVLIHSLFNEFGSRELVDGTGVLLNDRLGNLALEGDRAKVVRDGHRPVHTLNAYMVMQRGTPIAAGATPGGKGQVQTNLQVVSNLVDFGMDIQAAVDAPRWLSGTPRTPYDDRVVHFESGFPAEVIDGVRERGHEVSVASPAGEDLFGSCTVVGHVPERDVLVGAADYRRGAVATGL